MSLLLAGMHGVAADIQYSVTELPDLAPGFSTDAVQAINDQGQITGWSGSLGQIRAFLYSTGNMIDLGTLGGSISQGYGINNLGQITGVAATGAGSAQHAFVYSNGQMTDLGTLGGSFSDGEAINDAGQVAGYSTTSEGLTHAFLYSNGQMIDLNTLGGPNSAAYGINNLGQVTGFFTTATGQQHAFLYSNGQMIDLGASVGGNSNGMAINNLGQVVGQFTGSDGNFHAFLYSNGQIIDLGVDGFSFASAINDSGQIVGSFNQVQALLYSDGQVFNLNDLIDPSLGLVLYNALDINNEGQIAVQGASLHGSSSGAFLLTPIAIPEPNSLVLVCGALLVFLACVNASRRSGCV